MICFIENSQTTPAAKTNSIQAAIKSLSNSSGTSAVDVSNNISKAVANIPNLDHYQVIVSLSKQGASAFPTPPTKTISIEWDLGKVSGSLDETYDYLKRHVKDLVRAIHGQAKR